MQHRKKNDMDIKPYRIIHSSWKDILKAAGKDNKKKDNPSEDDTIYKKIFCNNSQIFCFILVLVSFCQNMQEDGTILWYNKSLYINYCKKIVVFVSSYPFFTYIKFQNVNQCMFQVWWNY